LVSYCTIIYRNDVMANTSQIQISKAAIEAFCRKFGVRSLNRATYPENRRRLIPGDAHGS
jgi:hypothetical protein